jgi:hypothetical protein
MSGSKKAAGVPVSLRALVQRINRKLADNGQCMKAARGEKARQEVGDYYTVDVRLNVLVEKDVDPETLGRDLGVLKVWECVR